jgi:hypothetical protein
MVVTREWGILGGILVKGTKFLLDRRTKPRDLWYNMITVVKNNIFYS